jgi:hypothetical protein
MPKVFFENPAPSAGAAIVFLLILSLALTWLTAGKPKPITEEEKKDAGSDV